MDLLESDAKSFDHAIRLANRLFNVPVALISIAPIDLDNPTFTEDFGFRETGDDRSEVAFAQSLSRCVIDSAQPLAIHDSRESLPSGVEAGITGHDVIAFLGVPLIGEAGRVLGSFCVTDRVPRIWTEDDVHDLEALGVAVAREIMAWRRAEVLLHAHTEELKEIDRRRDEFLSILGHELRGPIAAILSAVHLARQSEMDMTEIAWSHGVVERQSKQLIRLLDDLLDVSRLARGKIQLRKQSVAVADVIDRAVTAIRALSERKNQKLDVRLGVEPVMLHADPARIEQILINLLNNAVKYTEAKGRITVRAERSGGEVAITVSDTGAGINAEVLPHVFDLFSRMPSFPARTGGGLGIGLTLVKILTEMHGGRAEAASEGPGKGSRFSIRLPLSEEFTRATAETRTIASGGRANLRILVVDDNIDSATSMAMLLKVSGHEVRLAYDGDVAVDLALDQCPDAVLLDIGLPGRDGYSVAKSLRLDERCRGTFIVALSGYGRDEDRRRSREAGFDAHLVKPVDIDELLKLLSDPQSAAFRTGTN